MKGRKFGYYIPAALWVQKTFRNTGAGGAEASKEYLRVVTAPSRAGSLMPAVSRAFLRSQSGSLARADCCQTLGGRNTELAGTA